MAPQIVIRPASLRDITYTAANATPLDVLEVLSSGPSSMAQAALITWHLTVTLGGIAVAADVDGNPEATCGFVRQSEFTPWLFSAWMWGSKKTRLCAPHLIKHFKDTLYKDAVEKLGCTRIEARSHIEHRGAHRFLQGSGFVKETDLIDWGKDRARFVLFAMRLSDVEGQTNDVFRRVIDTSAITGPAAAVS